MSKHNFQRHASRRVSPSYLQPNPSQSDTRLSDQASARFSHSLVDRHNPESQRSSLNRVPRIEVENDLGQGGAASINDHNPEPNEQSLCSEMPPEDGNITLDNYRDFWKAYNKEADQEDKEMIKDYGTDLDTLLIFAGLFSAINTAFIIESHGDLEQDPSDITNTLLLSLIKAVRDKNVDEADIRLSEFVTPSRAIRVNTFFFLSLACSLFAAFGAVMAKQWLNHYEREGQPKTSALRGMARQRKYMGLFKWRFRAVVDTLPTLLQFSLFFFLIGLVDFLIPLNVVVATIVTVLSVTILLFWVITLIIGIFSPDSPFQTRLTLRLRKYLVRYLPCLEPGRENGVNQTNLNLLRAHCVEWLKQRVTFSDTIGVVAQAMMLLTEEVRREISSDHGGQMLAYLLQPSIRGNQVHLEVTLQRVQSSLTVLRDIIMKWDSLTELVHPQDFQNAMFRKALGGTICDILIKREGLETNSAVAALDILGKLQLFDLPNALTHDDLQKSDKLLDDIITITVLEALENSMVSKLPETFGYLKCYDKRHTQYLINSLTSFSENHAARNLRLSLLHDSMWTQDQLVIGKFANASHMPKILGTTMWGAKEPDLDPRRVTLRLAWFIQDVGGMYSYIEDKKLARYLDLWHDTIGQAPGSTISLSTASLTKLYLRTLIALLLCNQERWAKELAENYHLSHIRAISQDESSSSDTQLLCWTSFILMVHATGQDPGRNDSPSQHYSPEWVELVIGQLLRADGLMWASILNETLCRPDQVPIVMRSLYGYLQKAYHHRKFAVDKIPGLLDFVKKDWIIQESSGWNDGNFDWARDAEPFFEQLRKLKSFMEGLEDIKEKEGTVTSADIDRLLTLLQMASISPTSRSLCLDFLSDLLPHLPQQEIVQIVTSQSAPEIPRLIMSDMWKTNVDPRKVDRVTRQISVDESEHHLQLRRTWLEHSDLSCHTEFHQHCFTEYLSSWYDANQTQSETYVKTVGMLTRRAPDIWLSALEQDGHVERIAMIIETPPGTSPSIVQWTAFRLFLVMWRNRSESSNLEGTTPRIHYASQRPFKALFSFLSSLKSQQHLDRIPIVLKAQDLSPVNIKPMDFVASACTYLEEMATKQKIDPAVIEGYEICTDPVVCGASRANDYSRLDWNKDIAPWKERVAKLSRNI
ncbi:hypothetical protein FRC02_000912 [Tulasnella sp. 418]|nr:hypothetical protein FRC02_000912 [Tulasnella sp. 418]